MQRFFCLILQMAGFICPGLATLHAQISFTNRTELLGSTSYYSGVPVAIADMNGDGRDDIVRLNYGYEAVVVYQMMPGQPFPTTPLGNFGTKTQWGICVADVDNNGLPDILTAGNYDGITIARANAGGTGFSKYTATAPNIFAQGVNFADINNDGWLDAFICHDEGYQVVLANDGKGILAYQPNWIDLSTVPPSDGSGSYGSVWSDVDGDGDLDLYVSKCDADDPNPQSPHRLNQLFINNGDGTFTQDVANTSGLRSGAQSWTADFGDVDNDGDFDCFLTQHDIKCQLLENDGKGHFTDISAASGVDVVGGFITQGVFRDFDNDGYIDMLAAGNEHFLLRNNGNKTFTRVAPVFGQFQVASFALGDLNSDGFTDVYAAYPDDLEPSIVPDVLWFNNGNANHYLMVRLRGKKSNRSGVGAKVWVYTAAGRQLREVRAGESYGISNSLQAHFGLGKTTDIDSVVVQWPSGNRDVLVEPAADQSLLIEEGSTVAAGEAPLPGVLRFSPNPATAVMRVEMEGLAGERALLRLFDAQGRQLRATEVPLAGGRAIASFEISALPQGAYWVEVRVKNGVLHSKILIIR